MAAAMHDQYLIRIHAEHFTVWHYRIPFTTNHTLLAILYALGASITPGLVLGTILFVAGRLFSPPKKSLRTIFAGVVLVALAVEICALMAGFLAWRQKKGIFPEILYPDDTAGLAITQSIQITAYLSGMVFSLILITWIWLSRLRALRSNAKVNP